MSRDIILEKVLAVVELVAAIENALEALDRPSEHEPPLAVSEACNELKIVSHRDLGKSGKPREGRYSTLYVLNNGRMVLLRWTPTPLSDDAELRLAHDKALLARYGVPEEAINAYFQSAADK